MRCRTPSGRPSPVPNRWDRPVCADPTEESSIIANPYRSVRTRNDGADRVAAQDRLMLPVQAALSKLSVIQSALGACPERAVDITPLRPRDGPYRGTAQSFASAPALPFVVAQPARQARAQQAQPDISFAIPEHRGNIAGSQAVIHRECLPPSRCPARQSIVGGNQEPPQRSRGKRVGLVRLGARHTNWTWNRSEPRGRM